MYFSGFCEEKRCSVSMWMYSNLLSNSFYENIDYWYHTGHDVPKFDFPIQDPFEMDVMDTYSNPTALGVILNKKDKREARYVLAVTLFIISIISTLCTLYL